MGLTKQQAIAEGYFDRPEHDCHLSAEDGCEGCQIERQQADEELMRREIKPMLYVMKEINKVVPF